MLVISLHHDGYLQANMVNKNFLYIESQKKKISVHKINHFKNFEHKTLYFE